MTIPSPNASTSLHGRRVVITGAGRGIGRAIALAFAAAGARVVVNARRASDIEAVASEIERETGGEAHPVPGDIASPDDVDRLYREATARLGGIETLVNNAGRFHWGPFLETSADDWHGVFAVNVHGTATVTHKFLPSMLHGQFGRIINVASTTVGRFGAPNFSVYAASEHAIIGLTKCLALETAKAGVTVNALCVGLVDTEQNEQARAKIADHQGTNPDAVKQAFLNSIPMGRLVTVDEVAAGAVFLASREAQAITGICLDVAAGRGV